MASVKMETCHKAEYYSSSPILVMGIQVAADTVSKQSAYQRLSHEPAIITVLLPVLLYATESLVFRASSDINSLNNCINTAVAKIFHVSFGNGMDFIRQMTGLINLCILVAERRSRFFLVNCIFLVNIVLGLPQPFPPCIRSSNVILSNESCLRI